MTEIRVPKKIVNAPYWSLGDHFLRFDEAQDLTPEQIADLFASLGLGTMATQDEGTGAGDFRDNAANDARFMQPGDFGIGAVGNDTPLLEDFHDNSVPNGFYRWVGSTANAPGGQGGGAIKLTRTGGAGAWIAMRSAGSSGENEPEFYVKATSGQTDDWGPWRTLYHTGNLRSDAENDARFALASALTALENSLGSMASRDAGTANSQFRTNQQNDSRYPLASSLGSMASRDAGTSGNQFRTNQQNDSRYAQYTTSSNGELTNYPVGSIVLAMRDGLSGLPGRNSVQTVYIYTGNSQQFTINPDNGGAALAGAWMARGRDGQSPVSGQVFLMQRVS